MWYRLGEDMLIVATPIEEAETLARPDMLERWPTVIDIELRPRIVEAAPMMTPRTVDSVIIVVALNCAVFEVAFGGVIKRRGRWQ